MLRDHIYDLGHTRDQMMLENLPVLVLNLGVIVRLVLGYVIVRLLMLL